MQMKSQQNSVVISQDMPIIQGEDDKSTFNRLSKFARKMTQNEWISEFDLFSVPLKLNFNGEDTYKTEFGGLIYLMIGVCSIALTVMIQFPNGVVLNAPITFYGLTMDAGPTQTVFDYSDTFFTIYLANRMTGERLTGSNFTYYFQNITMWNVINGVPTQLELQMDAEAGTISFVNSNLNSKATIFGGPNDPTSNGRLQFQFGMCNGEICNEITDPSIGYFFMIDVANLIETDGGLLKKTKKITFDGGENSVNRKISFDRNQFTTNNNFFGFIANVFSYQLQYYTFGVSSGISYGAPTINPDCGAICITTQFSCNGNTNIVSQNFEDITVPLLFFLSVSQTIFYLVYLLFLRNYANNALKLKIADTLVYICQPNGKHYDFKSGLAVFVACLFHNHAFLEMVDRVLYALCQTEYKRYLPLKAQLTIDMINYGEDCLDEGEFFGEINEIYSQENVQPVKIIIDLESEEKQEEKAEEPQSYFEDATKEEAFRRMCEEHEFYSPQKKLYLKELLEETDKKYKLVLITQEIFEKYRRKVEEENHTKAVELPINFVDNQISGHNLKRQNNK